ncbi:MAG: hypothetical protein ACLQU1_43005 [Bryobacteraceae bacterium]
MEETTQATEDWIDMGAWVGRQQAFALIANKCSAAQALSLKQMKDTGCHDKLGLTWDDFCQRYIGLSRRHADRVISQYEEFGAAYFRLSTLARISAEDYREIAAALEDNCIEIDGEQVPIVPENAARIRAFVRSRRSPRPAEPKASSPPADPNAVPPSVPGLYFRLRALVEDVQKHVRSGLSDQTLECLKQTAEFGAREWKTIARRLDELNPRQSAGCPPARAPVSGRRLG